MKQFLTSLLDYCYPPFRKLMPLQTFRYAICGGMNTLLGLTAYYLGYTYIFAEKVVDIGFFAFKPHVAALFLSFIVSFIIGFLLNKYVVFTGSNLRGRIQLFRYLMSFLLNLLVNYLVLKLLVEVFNWDALLSQVLTTALIVSVSFLIQKHFSFKVKQQDSSI